jgi:hypothetical protein
VRGGDLLSAAVVYLGTGVLHLTVEQFAMSNLVLTLVWIGVAVLILNPQRALPKLAFRILAGPAAALALLVCATPAMPRSTCEETVAAQRTEKASPE